MKNIILKGTTFMMALLFMLSVAALDSDTWLPLITCIVSFIWLVLFYFTNLDYIVGGDDDV